MGLLGVRGLGLFVSGSVSSQGDLNISISDLLEDSDVEPINFTSEITVT